MGSKSRGMPCIALPMCPSPGLAMVTLLVLVEQRLSQIIVAASRSHPKGCKLEQEGPYFWHCQPTFRNHSMKNTSKVAHAHLQTASSNHGLKYECCSKPPWLWTSKGKGTCTGEMLILWFSASLPTQGSLHKLKQIKATLHFRCQSPHLKCWCSLIFLFDLLCHLYFHYHLLKYIQDNLFENRIIVKIQQIQVFIYCCYRLFSICFCEDCLVFWESGRVRTGKKTTKREEKKALSTYKIQELQMVTEPETSRCVELSQTANSWINPECL